MRARYRVEKVEVGDGLYGPDHPWTIEHRVIESSTGAVVLTFVESPDLSKPWDPSYDGASHVEIAADGLSVTVTGSWGLLGSETVDVDCLIAEGALAGLSDVLAREGYAEIERTPNFVRYRHGSGHLMDVDVLLVDPDTFERMRKESVPGQVGTLAARVPSFRHLIALKLHAIRNNSKREPRDVADIVDLLRANPGAIAAAEFRDLCEKYGPDGIRRKLEGFL
jgi:hypothetical protein